MYVIYSAVMVGLPKTDILTLSAQYGDYVCVCVSRTIAISVLFSVFLCLCCFFLISSCCIGYPGAHICLTLYCSLINEG